MNGSARDTRLGRAGTVRSRKAAAVIQRVFESVGHLAAFPRMRHVGRDEGTLEWVVPRLPYIVVYELDEARDEVVVIAVFHGARSREENG